MSLNAEPLRKIIELECKKGYADSAVIGGLDKYLRNWAGQTAESITSPKLLRRFNKLHLANSDYSSFSREQRKEWIESLLGFLAELEENEEEKGEVDQLPSVKKLPSKQKAKRAKPALSIDSTAMK